jgi:multidrug efflux pump subunit AcrA (membrane-fusion protein)
MKTRPWWQWVIAAFIAVVILSAIFGHDNADTSATTVTVTEAARPAQAQTTTQAAAPTLSDARSAADADDYVTAVAVATTLGPDAELAIRHRIANRIARRVLAAVQAGDRVRARTLLARAERFPATALTRQARSSYRAAKARAAERARTRRVAVEQRSQAAAQRRREQQAAAEAPPERSGDGCDPNYSGCVPHYPPDVNCPEVDGPVQVRGSDPHGLDRDNDGIACE